MGANIGVHDIGLISYCDDLINFFSEKFRKVERSFYSLNSLGVNSTGLNYFIISNIYKKFSQSSFYYGLETNYLRKECLNKINI